MYANTDDVANERINVSKLVEFRESQTKNKEKDIFFHIFHFAHLKMKMIEALCGNPNV